MTSSIVGSSSVGANELPRRSGLGSDSSRPTIEVTACFGQNAPPDAASQFWTATGSPTLPVRSHPRASDLIAVEPLATNDVESSGSGLFHAERSPARQDMAASSFAAVGGLGALQEITQNLRKTMVGLSNEAKARESEDWRLEQSFTQLDSRRELMCVQLHSRFEQSKHEIEALARQVGELHSRASSSDSSATERLAKECSNQVQVQIAEMQRVGASTSRLETQMGSLSSTIQMLNERQADLEAAVRLLEENQSKARLEPLDGAAVQLRSELQQLQTDRKEELQQLGMRCATFETRWAQVDEHRRQDRKDIEDLRATARQLELCIAQQGSSDRTSQHSSAVELEKLQSSIAQLNNALVESRAENNLHVDEKYTILENRLSEQFTDLRASSKHFESKLQNLSSLITSQDELLKSEVAARQDLQARFDILQSKGESEVTQLRSTLKETNSSSSSNEQVSKLQSRYDAQAEMLNSMKGLLDSLQGRMETFQSQAEGGRQQLEDLVRKERKGMDELCQKVEKTSLTLRELVEAQASGTEASLKRLDAELQEGRMRQFDEIRRLESRVSVSSEMSSQPEHGVISENIQMQLSSLRDQLKSRIDRLQLQSDALEVKVSSVASVSQAANETLVQDGFCEKAQLNVLRQEWKSALEDERILNAEKVKSLGRTVSEECRAQASTHARMVVQSMLAQELDAWRSELKSVSDHFARDRAPAQPRSKSRSRVDGEEEDDLLPAEVVKRLDDRLSLQRREAAALDEMLRSELEVQRRQQSLATAAMDAMQERLLLVEKQSDALRSQIENTFREEARFQDMEDSGPKNEELESALKVIADAVSDLPVSQQSSDQDVHRRIKKLSEKMAVACHSPPGSLAAPMVKSGSVSLPMVSPMAKHGSLHAPLGHHRGSPGLSSPRRMDEASKQQDTISSLGSGQPDPGPMYDTLNMPQALEELSRANSSRAAYVHRLSSRLDHSPERVAGSSVATARGGPRSTRVRPTSQDPPAAGLASSYSTPSLQVSGQPLMFSSPRPLVRQHSPQRGVSRQLSPPVPHPAKSLPQNTSARQDQNAMQRSLAENRIQRLSSSVNNVTPVSQAKQPSIMLRRTVPKAS